MVAWSVPLCWQGFLSVFGVGFAASESVVALPPIPDDPLLVPTEPTAPPSVPPLLVDSAPDVVDVADESGI